MRCRKGSLVKSVYGCSVSCRIGSLVKSASGFCVPCRTGSSVKSAFVCHLPCRIGSKGPAFMRGLFIGEPLRRRTAGSWGRANAARGSTPSRSASVAAIAAGRPAARRLGPPAAGGAWLALRDAPAAPPRRRRRSSPRPAAGQLPGDLDRRRWTRASGRARRQLLAPIVGPCPEASRSASRAHIPPTPFST